MVKKQRVKIIKDIKINLAWILGVLLSILIALAAQISSQFIGIKLLGFSKSPISAIMMAIIIGAAIGNIFNITRTCSAGLKFCASTLLRIGIMFLGIRLSLTSAGLNTILAIPFVLSAIASGLLIVKLFGRYLDLSNPLCGLVAVGTSICGVSAIAATAPMLKANETEISYSIACITVFGMIAMFMYPFLAHFLFSEKPVFAGIFLGTAIHETAQVAGAGLMYQSQFNSPEAFDTATITKLVRNLFMILVIPMVALLYRPQDDNEKRPNLTSLVPWFIIGFILMSAIRTIGDLGARPFGVFVLEDWENVIGLIKKTAELFLLIAMSAIGATAAFSNIRKIGFRPFLLGLFAASVVGGVTLLAIYFLGDILVAEILN